MRRADDMPLDEQVEDLRERMRLLQGDRKANIDILEANKAANQELVRGLRTENKELRKQLAAIQKEHALGRGGDQDEVDVYRREVNKLRSRFDELKSAVRGRQGELEALKDEAKDLELEARRPNLEDSPLTRKIRMLENRLDKAMIKYNEAQSIRKTYEQIVKRLKEERVGFDNQLAALERTLAAKQHDFEELKLLSGDANHAREVAQQELERVKGEYDEEKKARERDLRERQQIVQMKAEMANRMEQREKMRQDMLAREAGDLDEEGERSLKRNVAASRLAGAHQSEERKEHRSKIDIFENAFRKIKEATGVSDVNEVIQKIVSQESTTENLVQLTHENQTKIEALNEQKGGLKSRVEEVKYSGPGGGHRRKLVDDHEENLTSSATKLERCRLKYERLAKILISVKAGIEHLYDKLQNVREDSRHISQITDETIVDVLFQCEQTLVHLASQTKLRAHEAAEAAAEAGEDGAGGDDALGGASADAAGGDRPTSAALRMADAEVLQTRPFNRRIQLPSADDAEKTEEDLEDEVQLGINDVDEEELTRDKVKRASSQIIMQQDKRKKKPRRNKGDLDSDSAPVARSPAAARSTVGMGGGNKARGRAKRRTRGGDCTVRPPPKHPTPPTPTVNHTNCHSIRPHHACDVNSRMWMSTCLDTREVSDWRWRWLLSIHTTARRVASAQWRWRRGVQPSKLRNSCLMRRSSLSAKARSSKARSTGRRPSRSRRDASQPSASSVDTQSWCCAATARCNAVCPYRFTLSLGQPSRTSSSTAW